jgi:carbonic anhydrase
LISIDSLRGMYRASRPDSVPEPDRSDAPIAVVTCMDHRLRPERSLGIPRGSAYIVRNAGGRVTDDALRSLVVAWTQLEVNEFVVIQHTGCELATVTDEQVRHDVEEQLEVTPSAIGFLPIADLRSCVHGDVKRIRDSPFIPGELPVSGLIYDTATGRLEVVDADALSRIPSRLAAPPPGVTAGPVLR